jgi:hypothetical protein
MQIQFQIGTKINQARKPRLIDASSIPLKTTGH